jgi:hypothetical protein
MLVGVFICTICVKGSSQPQARVYLTFDGKRVDKKNSVKMLFKVLFFSLIKIQKLLKRAKYY